MPNGWLGERKDFKPMKPAANRGSIMAARRNPRDLAKSENIGDGF
jgi:hypothetical protein